MRIFSYSRSNDDKLESDPFERAAGAALTERMLFSVPASRNMVRTGEIASSLPRRGEYIQSFLVRRDNHR